MASPPPPVLDRTLAVLELSVSSRTAVISAPAVARWLSKHAVSAEVRPSWASIPHCGGSSEASHGLESGVTVMLYDSTPRFVKETLWPHLVNEYHLTCAYINAGHMYCGCVLNWPGVFCPSRCPGAPSLSTNPPPFPLPSP